MSFRFSNSTRLAAVAAIALLAGCAQQNQAPAAPPVAYNPPGTALAALPTGDVTWYHVMFASNSYQIDPSGRQAIDNVADRMMSNSALTATLVGKTDSVGSDAANMRLSQQRAAAVRTALLETGKIPARRIETRWTGERPQDGQTASGAADASNRAVDIGVH